MRRHSAIWAASRWRRVRLPRLPPRDRRAAERLALAGRHRFSTYLLRFRLEEAGPGSTRLVAETRAAFPGLKGSVYRAVVIGTRMHVVVTRRLLTATKRRAERS